jgi:hypothetical protein
MGVFSFAIAIHRERDGVCVGVAVRNGCFKGHLAAVDKGREVLYDHSRNVSDLLVIDVIDADGPSVVGIVGFSFKQDHFVGIDLSGVILNANLQSKCWVELAFELTEVAALYYVSTK